MLMDSSKTCTMQGERYLAALSPFFWQPTLTYRIRLIKTGLLCLLHLALVGYCFVGYPILH
jgi:hypothetical protein